MALERMMVRDERSVARVANATEEADRRTHLRLPAEDVLWLQGVRIKYGAEVRVIDISAGGVLVETESELKADSTVVFEVSGADSTMLVPSRVVRCTPVTNGGMTRYQTACAFKRSLSLHDLMLPTGRTEVTAPPTSTARAIGQKVVARFLDGRLVRGFTNDFHTSKAHLHLSDDAASDSLFVQISQLKALFFVREFDGDPNRIDRNEFPGATHGRKVEVTFSDGEVLVGTTLGFRGPEHPFFVHPADIASNNLRVFVTPAATRLVRFV
jgi:hypothetical protein